MSSDLEGRLRQTVPQLRFVSARQLNRVLTAMTAAAGVRVPLNARLPVWVNRADAGRFGVPAELSDGAEPQLLLLTPPGDRLMSDADDAAVTATYQRLLNRAVFAKSLADEVRWPEAELTQRFQAYPEAVRREVCYVLQAEHLVPNAPTDAEVYRAFATLHQELAADQPEAVHDYFPLLADADRSRNEPPAEPAPPPSQPPAGLDDLLAHSPNVVRTAVGYYQRPEDRDTALALLREGLGGLLADALHWDEARTARWKDLLAALLPFTAGGRWTPAAKALYELQALALDRRDRLSAVAPVEWLRSLGRLPLRRPLDKARDAILLRHLAKAHKQIDHIPLPPAVHNELEGLLEAERHAAEDRIRQELGPIIRDALTRARLTPANRVEAVARDKLVAELLDIVCGRGFFRLSDFRDAVARNDLKLPDAAGVQELWAGDALLRADRLLSEELFGVYQRGEVYLRGIQRLTGAAFGTRPGRAVTLFALLPLLGAFLTLEFAQHVLHAGRNVAGFVGLLPKVPPHTHHGPHLVVWWSLLLVAGLYVAVLNSPTFRAAGLRVLRGLGTALGAVFVTLPQRVWASGVVQALVRNPLATFLWQTVALPLAAAGVAFVVAVLYDFPPHRALAVAAVTFLAALLALRSAAGRRLYEQVSEGVLGMGRYVWASLVPGVVSWIVWLFREVAGAVEQVLYTADEWLRFRDGQSREAVVLKTAVAVVWFPIAYVVRFVFYLLVEPQVNPVKHFPVVTVSHKVIWPMVPQISAALGISEWHLALMVNGVPGIFGFMAWELMENWRLYAANRADELRPVTVGHHGESVRGLLRPGFHAGTVPKTYRRLRSLHHTATAPPAKVTRARHDLDHAAEAVRHFVERELLPLIDEPGVSLGRVTVGCQRIELDVGKATAAGPLVLAWELRDEELCAEVVRDGWLTGDAHENAVRTAVSGLNAKAAVPSPTPWTWAAWAKYWGPAS